VKIAHCLGATVLAASVLIATTQGAGAAKKTAATPAPSAGASAGASPGATPSGAAGTGSPTPVPLPTATPEPPSSAIPRLEAKVKANPNDRDSLGQLATYYLQVGRPDLAITATQRLVGLGMKTTQVYYLDGVANRELGRSKQAIDDFEQAANLEPTNSDVLGTLTSLYLDASRPQDAERVAKRATTFNPNDKKAFENYGAVYEAEKKYDDARTQYEAAAKLDPKDAGPIVLQAQSYLRQDALALAGQLYDRALAVDPKYPDALLGKARLLATEHDVKGAIALYDQLTPLLPADEGRAALLIEEARLYSVEKMSPEATVTIKKAIDTYPKLSAVHVAYGDFLVGQKDLPGAQREWETAIGIDGRNPDALQRLGDLYSSQNKPQQAIDEYKKLVQAVPNNAAAWTELGQAFALKHEFEGSRDAYRRSFELARTPSALAGLGSSDYELHQYKECAQVFDAIDRGAGDYLRQNPQYLVVMGNCYKGTQQPDKARSAFQRLLALVKPNTPAHAQVQKLIDGVRSSPARPSAHATAAPKAKH